MSTTPASPPALDRAVLVTGAARRVGASIAHALGVAGWFVHVHYRRSAAEAEAVVAGIRQAGGKAAAIEADFEALDADGAARLIKACAEAGPPLVAVINNASLFEYDTAASVSEDRWQRHLQANLTAPVLLARAFAERAKALPAPAPRAPRPPEPDDEPAPRPRSAPRAAKPAVEAAPEEPPAPPADEAAGLVAAMLKDCRFSLAQPLRSARPSLEGSELTLSMAPEFAAFAELHLEDYQALLRKAAGRSLKLRVVSREAASEAPASPAEEKKQRLVQEATKEPAVQEALDLFGGRVVGVRETN